MNRTQALSALADRIAAIHLDHPVRVGIDGVDAAGKTTLADELVEPLRARGRAVIRASVDGFHNPRRIRYRQGRRAPQGYYDDSFDYDAVVAHVLDPLGPDGNLIYRPVAFDFTTDSEVHGSSQSADPDAILLFDGIFLHRPELRSHWDFYVFVHVDFDVAVERAQTRDRYLFETAEEIREMYEQRYVPAQRIYLTAESPASRASVIWNNNDVENPVLTWNE